MDVIIVGVIVSAAVFFTLRSFIRIYKGEDSCSCGGCSCRSKKSCDQGSQILEEK